MIKYFAQLLADWLFNLGDSMPDSAKWYPAYNLCMTLSYSLQNKFDLTGPWE